MAKWIWLDDKLYPEFSDNTRENVFSLNQKSFCMAEFTKAYELKDKATLKICADARYELYINGSFKGRGPSSPGSDFLTEKMNYCYYDEYEITDTPSAEIKVIVTSAATALNEFTFGHPGLYAELISKGEVIGGTDEGWSARYLAERKSVFYTDYTSEPHPITVPKAIPDIHNMLKCPTERLREDSVYPTAFDKITVKPREKAIVSLDFDKIYSAFPEITVKADGKARVLFESGEIDGIGSITEEFVTDRDTVHRCQRMRSVGYIKVTLENLSESDAVLENVKIAYSYYPVKNETTLTTSDEFINKLYSVCMHTLKICRQNTHLDSPTHQEPLACTGDYYIQALMEYMNIYDPALTAFDIFRTSQFLEIQNGRMFHTSYSLIYPMWIYNYYMHTSDTELVKKTKKSLECLFSRFETYVSDDNCLLEKAPDYMFVDWIVMKDAPDPYGDAKDIMSHGKTEGFSLHHPPKVLGQSVLCMFYYKALVCGEKLFLLLNDEKNAVECRKNAEKIKNAINMQLYDKEKGLYIGGLNTPNSVPGSQWLPDNIERIFYLKQANVLAVLFGIAPKSEREKILDYVMKNLRKEEMQPYFYHFLFEAIYNEGLFAKYGFELIAKYEGIIKKCDKGLCEAWEYINGDCSHSWGGAPAYILKKALSGFEMIESGYKKIKLDPNLYSLDYADFEISTPYGPIVFKLNKSGNEISVPEEIEVI